eukprot:TRINITY_DN68199_c0_g1_i1.p1 TRINITY_DN68199_c0_g1~~TRINITY_DN68199_c0_g1_i1.p1  ORF type:complete len:578 (+),score=35.14 TRINITY_DN68199_c0_g1_i1:378-2111(+)
MKAQRVWSQRLILKNGRNSFKIQKRMMGKECHTLISMRKHSQSYCRKSLSITLQQKYKKRPASWPKQRHCWKNCSPSLMKKTNNFQTIQTETRSSNTGLIPANCFHTLLLRSCIFPRQTRHINVFALSVGKSSRKLRSYTQMKRIRLAKSISVQHQTLKNQLKRTKLWTVNCKWFGPKHWSFKTKWKVAHKLLRTESQNRSPLQRYSSSPKKWPKSIASQKRSTMTSRQSTSPSVLLTKKSQSSAPQVFYNTFLQLEEERRIKQIFEEVTSYAASVSKAETTTVPELTSSSHSDHNKSLIKELKTTIANLESEIKSANRQIEVLKKDQKLQAIKQSLEQLNKSVTILPKIPQQQQEEKPDTDSLKSQLEEAKIELQAERQLSETWLGELEVAAKAYEEEKRRNKELLQQVEELNGKVVQFMSDIIKEGKLRIQLDDSKKAALQKISYLEKEAVMHKKLETELETTIERYKKLIETMTKENTEKDKIILNMKEKCMKNQAKIEETRKELEYEKKVSEEWQAKYVKNQNEKNVSNQLCVNFKMIQIRSRKQLKEIKRMLRLQIFQKNCRILRPQQTSTR